MAGHVQIGTPESRGEELVCTHMAPRLGRADTTKLRSCLMLTETCPDSVKKMKKRKDYLCTAQSLPSYKKDGWNDFQNQDLWIQNETEPWV